MMSEYISLTYYSPRMGPICGNEKGGDTMKNTTFLEKVEKTTKEVDGLISAVVTTVICVVTTTQMIRDTFFKKSN